MKIPVAWLQLTRDRLRLLVAIGGVAFAIVLVFMQLGFLDALFKSAVRMHNLFRYDLAMISPKTPSLVYPADFSRQRVVQARGFAGVRSAELINLGYSQWKNPAPPRNRRAIYVIGFDPAVSVIDIPEVEAQRHQLSKADVCIFDEKSRKEFGPVAELMRQQGSVTTELDDRRVRVLGLFSLGTSFGIDANIITSNLNFYRYLPNVDREAVKLGLITLEDDADAIEVRETLVRNLPEDVLVLTRDEFVHREVDFWDSATPTGFVLGLGALVGLIVASIIVYQILFSNITDHMKEYATLKALGYSNAALSGIVFRQAIVLAILGFIPATIVSTFLYRAAGTATQLPMEMSLSRGSTVFGLTLLICVLSAIIAQRKVRKADPAELF